MTEALTCSRCGRESPDPETSPSDWEHIDGRLVCSRCLTGEDAQAIFEQHTNETAGEGLDRARRAREEQQGEDTAP